MTSINNELLLDLSRRLIQLVTFDPPGNELPAAQLVASVLADYDIASELQSIGPNRANVVARIKGAGQRPALIFSAHLDTIGVEEEQWSVAPFGAEVREGRLYGRGATDMKAALAAMAVAGIALQQQRGSLQGDLILAFSAAENSSCLGAKHMLDSGVLKDAGALLISEPTSLDVFTAEKGALWLRATAKGEYGHNAFSEDRSGDRGSAILRMAEFLCRVRDLSIDAPAHPLLGPPTVNVGLIEGGISFPLIAPICTASIDVRTVPGLDTDAVIEQFRAIAGEHVTIEFLDLKPPVDTPTDHPFVEQCVAAVRDERGVQPVVTGVPYYTDGAVLAPALGIPMVIVGPGEVGKSGSVDEYVELAKLEASARIFLDIAQRYLA
ncbi:M20 family metallopeptidase [Paraburkholderia agricolaris]|uniref:M20 family metallopeptidase n=1 Tax=Paraburkholderia agricolaris TaxID=2152888 RepID=UPI0038BDD5BC